MDSHAFLVFAQTSAQEFSVGVTTLATIALVSRSCNRAVQWRLARCRRIRAQYAPRLKRAYIQKLLRGPLRYNEPTLCNTRVKVTRVQDVGIHELGMAILDTDPPLNISPGSALANVTLFAHQPIPIILTLSLGNASVFTRRYSHDSYVFVDGADGVGKYVLDLELPTVSNPVPIDGRYLHRNLVRLGLAPWYEGVIPPDQPVTYFELSFSSAFVAECFTHCVSRFYTFEDIDMGTMVYNGMMNHHIFRFSFVRRLRDHATAQYYEPERRKPMWIMPRAVEADDSGDDSGNDSDDNSGNSGSGNDSDSDKKDVVCYRMSDAGRAE